MTNFKLKMAAKIGFFIYLLLISFAFVMIASLDIFPIKYIYIAAGIVGIISIILAVVIFRNRTGRKGRIVALIICLLMIALLVVGSVFMAKTNLFLRGLGDNGKDLVEYAVVVKSDSSMEELKDIDGKDVYVTDETTVEYLEAQGKLTDEAGKLDPAVTFKYEHMRTARTLMRSIIKDDIEAAFIQRGTYDAYCDEDDEIDSGTKVIYSVFIERKSKASAKAVDVTSTTFNVYITGLDTSGSIDIQSRSDVNMVMTVNPVTKKMLLTSIPRDYYVKLHTAQAMDKLTHTGIYGPDETVATVEDLLGIDINYYFKCNFSTVSSLVDAVHGIDVVSEHEFTTHGRQNNGYKFVVGENHLDGKAALAFARERKSFAGGDRQRIKNQQLVVEATLNKVTSSKTLLMNYGSILAAISEYMETSFTENEIKEIVKMQLGDMSSWDIKKITLDGKGSSERCYALGNAYASVILQDEESLNAAKNEIASIYQSQESTDTTEQ